MNRIFVSVTLLLLNILIVNSQTESKDSIYSGRVCIIILKNGFEADGIITMTKPDTIWFKNEYSEYKIPVDQIKFVRDINEQPDDVEAIKEEVYALDTTEECDLYLETGSIIKDVSLLPYNDSNILIIKEGREKIQPIAPIRKIVFVSSGFGKGFFIGAAIGFASGLLMGLTWPEHSEGGSPNFGQSMLLGLVFSLPTGLIGGIIGGITKTDDKYLLAPGYSKTKAKRIKYILEQYKE